MQKLRGHHMSAHPQRRIFNLSLRWPVELQSASMKHIYRRFSVREFRLKIVVFPDGENISAAECD